jgi:hypothetical protein
VFECYALDSIHLRNDCAFRDDRWGSSRIVSVFSNPIPSNPNALVGADFVLEDRDREAAPRGASQMNSTQNAAPIRRGLIVHCSWQDVASLKAFEVMIGIACFLAEFLSTTGFPISLPAGVGK